MTARCCKLPVAELLDHDHIVWCPKTWRTGHMYHSFSAPANEWSLIENYLYGWILFGVNIRQELNYMINSNGQNRSMLCFWVLSKSHNKAKFVATSLLINGYNTIDYFHLFFFLFKIIVKLSKRFSSSKLIASKLSKSEHFSSCSF